MEILHTPIMVKEILQLLDVRPGGFYVDGTLGDGGHAEAILEGSAPDGRLLALDRDQEAVLIASRRLDRFRNRVVIKNLDFSRISEAVADAYSGQGVDGILLDLGVSSRQLTVPDRGFGFSRDGPLDMRMDRSQKKTAMDLVNDLSKEELTEIIKKYGEETRWAKRIAGEIVRWREKEPISRTGGLAEIVAASIPQSHRRSKTHPATRVFQALRIAVNDELGMLERTLPRALDVLRPGGRLAVISFHSLEDRIVKNFFGEGERPCVCPTRAPQCYCGKKPVLRRVTAKALCPGKEEVIKNPRSRSAKLRVAEKLEATA